MTAILKPAPWPYDPARTRLPAISALLGAAYPMWEGSGLKVREIVSGLDEEFRAGSAPTEPPVNITGTGDADANPERTVAHQFSGHSVRVGAVGYGATSYPAPVGEKGVFLVAEVNGGAALTTEEARYATDPLTRFALIVPDGGDYSAKPAPWAWAVDLLNPIAQAIVAKLSLLAPIWEGSGDTYDLISGHHQLSTIEWGVIEGMTCALFTGIGSGITWENHDSLTDVPWSKIVVVSEMRGPGEQVYVNSDGNGMAVEGAAVQGGYFNVYTDWSDPLDPTGPSIRRGFTHQGRDYGGGIWAFCLSLVSRIDPGAWAINGSDLLPPMPSAPQFVQAQVSTSADHTALADVGNGGQNLFIGGGVAPGRIYLDARFTKAPPQQIAELLSDPANRYILLREEGADYSVKPAPWAWDVELIDSRIRDYARASMFFLAAGWETVGSRPRDLVNDIEAIDAGGGDWGTDTLLVALDGDGVPCMMGTGANGRGAAIWTVALPGFGPGCAHLLIGEKPTHLDGDNHNSEFGGETQPGRTFLNIGDGHSGYIGSDYIGYGSYRNTPAQNQSSETIERRNQYDWGAGIHSYLASELDRWAPGPWRVDGQSLLQVAVPAGITWRTAAGLLSAITTSDTIDRNCGFPTADRFGLVLVFRNLKALAEGGWGQFCGGYSATDGSQWWWIAPSRYGPPSDTRQVIEVECSVADSSTDTPNNRSNYAYRQFDFIMPEGFVYEDDTPYALIVDHPSREICTAYLKALPDGPIVELEHATDIETQYSGDVGDPFTPPTDVPLDSTYFGYQTQTGRELLGYLAFPDPLTAPQRTALLADPFGPVAPADVVAGGSSTAQRRRRIRHLLGKP